MITHLQEMIPSASNSAKSRQHRAAAAASHGRPGHTDSPVSEVASSDSGSQRPPMKGLSLAQQLQQSREEAESEDYTISDSSGMPSASSQQGSSNSGSHRGAIGGTRTGQHRTLDREASSYDIEEEEDVRHGTAHRGGQQRGGDAGHSERSRRTADNGSWEDSQPSRSVPKSRVLKQQ